MSSKRERHNRQAAAPACSTGCGRPRIRRTRAGNGPRGPTASFTTIPHAEHQALTPQPLQPSGRIFTPVSCIDRLPMGIPAHRQLSSASADASLVWPRRPAVSPEVLPHSPPPAVRRRREPCMQVLGNRNVRNSQRHRHPLPCCHQPLASPNCSLLQLLLVKFSFLHAENAWAATLRAQLLRLRW